MFELQGPDPLSVCEPTQSPAEKTPGLSGREPRTEAERRNPKDGSEDRHTAQTRPDIPHGVYLESMDYARDDVYSHEEKRKAWETVASMTLYHNDAMVERWNKEIDTYLVFAGLFSAVLTAFNVQSYILLQPAAPDPSLAVLQQMSAQLTSFSINPPSINSTQRSTSDGPSTNTPPPVPRWAVWLNALWFSSLILSLSSASIGILVKQWLSENTSDSFGTSRDITRRRKYRLDNLVLWRVEDIIDIIPVLLQSAVALFLAGLLVLLWNIHHGVAAVSAILIALLAIFTICTTVLPLYDPRCAYVSPPTRYLYKCWGPKRFAYWLCVWTTSGCRTTTRFFRTSEESLCDLYRHISSFLSPHRWNTLWNTTLATLRRLKRIALLPEDWRESKKTWQDRERSAVDVLARDLDTQILVEAYSSTLHPDALSAAAVCLTDFPYSDVVTYFRRLHQSARKHFGDAVASKDGPLGRGNQQQLLWLQIILCVLLDGGSPLSGDEVAALRVHFKHGSWSSGMQAPDSEWAVSTLNSMSDYLDTWGTSSEEQYVDQDRLQMERGYLIDNAMGRDIPLTKVLLLDVTRTYREVRLKGQCLTDTSVEDTKAAHMVYLQSVDPFLERAERAMTSPLSSTDLNTVRTYMQDVLTELTGFLLDLFAQDKMWSTIEAECLRRVMWEVRRLDDRSVEECIPHVLVPDILHLAEKLETAPHYIDNNVWGINEYARTIKANIIRVKGKPNPA
ncbi:hypothetical protein VTO73DRAFT_12742 [Trametes versicolor]